MANSTKPRYDNVTIFDEFEDEERKALIKSMIDAGSLMSQLHRHNFFLLWFSDIKTLRTLAAASNPFKALIREIFGQWIPAEDFPGICKYTKERVCNTKLTIDRGRRGFFFTGTCAGTSCTRRFGA